MKAVVVIPTYNEAAALPSLLDAVLETGADVDVLVVDDSFARRHGPVRR